MQCNIIMDGMRILQGPCDRLGIYLKIKDLHQNLYIALTMIGRFWPSCCLAKRAGLLNYDLLVPMVCVAGDAQCRRAGHVPGADREGLQHLGREGNA